MKPSKEQFRKQKQQIRVFVVAYSAAMETKNRKNLKQEIGVESSDSSDLVANNHKGIVQWFREVPPAHYILKIESFSLFLHSNSEIYESRAFEAGGYKWKLTLYPNGNKKSNANGHISLYLTIAETKALPVGWEINASFKLFVFDHIRDRYLTFQFDDVNVMRRFHPLKTEWGFDKLLPLDTFKDTSNGYLVDDCCAFGAEVFVIEHNGKGECVSMITNPKNNTFTWKIEKLSAVDKIFIRSDEFVVGGHKWNLTFYPKGSEDEKDKYVSIFLELADWKSLASEEKVYAEYKLRIREQLGGIHIERKAEYWFSAVGNNLGFSNFLSLTDLNNAARSYLVNDTVIVDAEIMLMSSLKDI